MIKRLFLYVVGALIMLSASGCLVAESTYMKKAGEADALSGELAGLRQAHEKLLLDNADLQNRLTGCQRMLHPLPPIKNSWRGFLRQKLTRCRKTSVRRVGRYLN